MNSKYYIQIFFTILIIFLINGCEDEPNPVGVSILPRSDLETTHIDTIIATRHTSSKYLLNTILSDRVMLGINRLNNGWLYKAIACLKFTDFPDSLIDRITIDSAYIKLKKVYTFGDSTLPLTFNAYSATASWEGDSISYDSLGNAGIYYNNVPININYSEDSEGYLTINILDTALIRSWFTSNSTNEGLILTPIESGNRKSIKGFYSFNNTDTISLPKLIIKFKSDTYEGTDTIFTGVSKYVSYMSTGSFQLDTDSMMYIQNGISYHGHLWFDNFTIPWASSIYRATLELTMDASVQTEYLNEGLYATGVGVDNKIDIYKVFESKSTSIIQNKKIHKFEIATLLNAWKNGNNIQKIVIYGKSQSQSFDLFKLYGTNCSKEFKPRIIVTYFKK